MRDLNRFEAVAFIFSTHNPEIIQSAKRIIRLRDGLVVGDERVADGGVPRELPDVR